MSGTFGSIEKRIGSNGSFLAYKTYSKSHGKLVYRHYERELWALKQLKISSKENHIIYLIDNQETSTCYHLIFPFYDSTLQERCNEKNIELANDFIQQISKGLSYLHENNIIHCDLSPGNILIDSLTGCMVICDFGCAHSSSDNSNDSNEEVGTRYYKAPEHLFGSKRYSSSTDIWSLGAIYAQLLIGYPVFAGESDIEQIGRVVSRLGKPSKKVEHDEMHDYPDTNKLMFFSDNYSDDDYEDEYSSESDDEEMEALRISRIPLKQLINDDNLSEIDKQLILGILTWSIQDRLTIPEILALKNQS
ncbi:kinase-like domain-containing protein [Thamnidium elegans]|uniref:Protein kinase domain-containing protein n=1 Tax=Thamnidium elegans TaxID=101142 RepID=A0A8H7VU40_9FUNG|nr:hypothetical protein INT48_008800 [Thamnidium elegans]KAI8081087.1 kinase-like domain-containing protein [Thamnidium elegans]